MHSKTDFLLTASTELEDPCYDLTTEERDAIFTVIATIVSKLPVANQLNIADPSGATLNEQMGISEERSIEIKASMDAVVRARAGKSVPTYMALQAAIDLAQNLEEMVLILILSIEYHIAVMGYISEGGPLHRKLTAKQTP